MADLAALAGALQGVAQGLPRGMQMGADLARSKAAGEARTKKAQGAASADQLFQENKQRAEAQIQQIEQQLSALLPAIEQGSDPNADAQFEQLVTRHRQLKAAYQKFVMPYLRRPSAEGAMGAEDPLATLNPEGSDAGY